MQLTASGRRAHFTSHSGSTAQEFRISSEKVLCKRDMVCRSFLHQFVLFAGSMSNNALLVMSEACSYFHSTERARPARKTHSLKARLECHWQGFLLNVGMFRDATKVIFRAGLGRLRISGGTAHAAVSLHPGLAWCAELGDDTGATPNTVTDLRRAVVSW